MEWLWPVLIIVAVLLLVGIYLWSTYNSLVQLNVRVDEAWSGITVQLKRRADLIPNLIETVRGYAAHEKEVFEGVTRARAETLSASGPAEAGVAEGHLQQALRSLFAVAEARSCRPARTICSCSTRSSTPKTRSRPRAASTTAVCAS